MELVSIIIPTYKRYDTLDRAVKSVLNQSYENLEVIVVDDDLTNEKLDLDIDDARVQIIKNKRTKGANGARNTGILEAKGHYVAFLDDDDEWLENKLSTQVSYLKSKDSTFGGVYSSYRIERKGKWGEYFGSKEGDIMAEVILDEVKVCAGSNLLIKAEVIKEVGLWDEDLKRQQDLEFLIRMLNRFKLAYCDNISLKIYGHNTPNFSKAYQAREQFVSKINPFVRKLDKKTQNVFYSHHNRRQAMYLFQLKRFKEGLKYWKNAQRFESVSIKKDIRIIMALMSSLKIEK